MTIQTKHFIEISDIVAVRFVCKHCDAGLTLSLSDPKLSTGAERPQTFLSRCPSCGQDWAQFREADYEPVIRRATVALNELKRILEGDGKVPLGFDFSLEIRHLADIQFWGAQK